MHVVKLGNYDEAIKVFNAKREKRSECCPDIVTYTGIMHMYSLCGLVENCHFVFNTMVANGQKPNIVSYNALLGAYASLGLSEPTSSVFNEMKQNGLRSDVVSYTSLLNSYRRSEQPWKARKVFDMMRQKNCKPNLVTYYALIDGFLAEAVYLLREMDQFDRSRTKCCFD